MGLFSSISSAVNSVSRSASSAINSVSRNVSSAINSASRNVSSAVSSTSRNISSAVSSASSNISKTVTTVQNNGANLVNSINVKANSAVEQVKNASQANSNILSGIGTAVSDAASNITKNPALLPVALPLIAIANAGTAMNAGADFVKGASSAINTVAANGSAALQNFNADGYRITAGSILESNDPNYSYKVTVNQGEITGNTIWVNTEGGYDADGNYNPGAYAYGSSAIGTSHYLDPYDRQRTLDKYLSKGWISQSDYDAASSEIARVDAGTNKAYWASQQPVSTQQAAPNSFFGNLGATLGSIFNGAQQTNTATAATKQNALVAANNPISVLSDTIYNAKMDMFQNGFENVWTGNNVTGGVVSVGTSAVAETLLPFDLINVTNKLATGRADSLEPMDYLWAVADAGLVVGGILTGGTLYVGGKAIKTAAKNGKNMVKIGSTMNTASIGGQVGMTGAGVIQISDQMRAL